jgi:hypothetical protein
MKEKEGMRVCFGKGKDKHKSLPVTGHKGTKGE